MERLQTLYGCFNVYINKLSSDDKSQFHISFVDNKNILHVLIMDRILEKWVITEKETHPGWIIVLEEQLTTLIQKLVIADYYLPRAV